MVCSILELCFTKMVFLKSDCKYSLIVALLYIPVNYFGGKYIYGHSVYDDYWVDWHNPALTLAVWTAQGGVQYLFNYITAIVTQYF